LQQHLRPVLNFLPALILPSADPSLTSAVAKPFRNSESFTIQPTADNSQSPTGDDTDDRVRRKAALKFLISLSGAKLEMVRKLDGWAAAILRSYLNGMGELGNDNVNVWLEADVRPVEFSVI
jgi:importin-5